jgi:hypothetical protein
VIKAKDRDMVKLTKKARLCLPGLAKETFVPDKDNKSKIEFIQHINTAKSNNDLALTLVQNNLINIKAIQKAKVVLKKIEHKD